MKRIKMDIRQHLLFKISTTIISYYCGISYLCLGLTDGRIVCENVQKVNYYGKIMNNMIVGSVMKGKITQMYSFESSGRIGVGTE